MDLILSIRFDSVVEVVKVVRLDTTIFTTLITSFNALKTALKAIRSVVFKRSHLTLYPKKVCPREFVLYKTI
ncbi:MAG: hypothetical protein H8E00_00140 [Deltaproteobacteria bacterium]|nr:hypothetical protein [Deltaproteobacteria bacterium]